MGYYKPYKSKIKFHLKPFIVGSLIGIITALATFFIYSESVPFGNTRVGAEETVDQTTDPLKNVTYNLESTYMRIPKAIERVDDAVVSITTYQDNQYFIFEPQRGGTGSGVIYKKAGEKAFVVTNNHVIDGGKKLEVTLNDGTKLEAKLVGRDVFTDLAVLEIDGENVKEVAKLGSSDQLKLGEPVIAIGSPLGDTFSGSVTQGILSGKERTIPVDINRDGRPDWQADVIQTDAAINPGNSGGALINIFGEVIGINSMKIAQEAVEGIGFAIPISIAKPIIKDLELYKEVKRPFIGVSLEALSNIPTYHWSKTLQLPDNVKKGVAIIEVVPQSPADVAGLKKYDVIIALDEQEVSNDIDIRKYIYTKKKIGETLEITYFRNGKKQSATLKLKTQDTY